MNAIIRKGIEDARLIRFSYKGSTRTVEPHAIGRQNNGADALCAWQLSGGSGQEFRLFRVDEITALSLLDEEFEGARPGYRRGDSRFTTIYAQL